MCGFVQEQPLERTEDTQRLPRQRAETMPKGSLARTIDVDAMTGLSQQLVGFVAVYVNGKPAGVFWPLYSGETLLGRSGGGVQPDIALNAPSVSARHARIFSDPANRTFTLHDQGSRNGTELNGERLRAGEARPVEDNAVIKLGLVTLVLKILPE